jgi:hypothetical protein
MLLLLLVLVLGLFRQVGVLAPAGRRSDEPGLREGKGAPKLLLDQIVASAPRLKSANGITVAFVTESCIGCQRLLSDVERPKGESFVQSLVIVAKDPSAAFGAALRELPCPVIVDNEGELWRACRVTATPLVLHINAAGKVMRKEVTHDVSRVAIAPRS